SPTLPWRRNSVVSAMGKVIRCLGVTLGRYEQMSCLSCSGYGVVAFRWLSRQSSAHIACTSVAKPIAQSYAFVNLPPAHALTVLTNQTPRRLVQQRTALTMASPFASFVPVHPPKRKE